MILHCSVFKEQSATFCFTHRLVDVAFFIAYADLSFRQLAYISTRLFICQALFKFFCRKFLELILALAKYKMVGRDGFEPS